MKKPVIKIKKSVYKLLVFDTPCAPPESGGIIGGADGAVTYCVKDFGIASTDFNRYQPNVEKLNCAIADWISRGIDFVGVFHTHPSGDEKLSQADCEYIESIMRNVGEYTDRLYFPLVIPQEKIIGYCAVNIAGEISVFQTVIEII